MLGIAQTEGTTVGAIPISGIRRNPNRAAFALGWECPTMRFAAIQATANGARHPRFGRQVRYRATESLSVDLCSRLGPANQ